MISMEFFVETNEEGLQLAQRAAMQFFGTELVDVSLDCAKVQTFSREPFRAFVRATYVADDLRRWNYGS